jgi:hypothetical protein
MPLFKRTAKLGENKLNTNFNLNNLNKSQQKKPW